MTIMMYNDNWNQKIYVESVVLKETAIFVSILNLPQVVIDYWSASMDSCCYAITEVSIGILNRKLKDK